MPWSLTIVRSCQLIPRLLPTKKWSVYMLTKPGLSVDTARDKEYYVNYLDSQEFARSYKQQKFAA